MKIVNISEDSVTFSNGKKLTYEKPLPGFYYGANNYAVFSYLEEEAGIFDVEFTEPLSFEILEDEGFRFGNEGIMFFVPCYSEQNGFYSSNVDIIFDGVKVCGVNGEQWSY